MTLRVEHNYQVIEVGSRKFAVESFENLSFVVTDYETGADIGSVTASTDDDLLAQVQALIAGLAYLHSRL